MKVLVTGAGGFLGRAVSTAAQRAGHEVVALKRPAVRTPSTHGIVDLYGDLRQSGKWCAALEGVEAVVHCAAAFGDLPAQLSGTVLGTENLLAALPRTVRRIVHVSTLSVYDFDASIVHGRLDEQAPLELRPERRDAYTVTKLQQERMVRVHAETHGMELVVVRPGAIFGPGKDWDAGRAFRLGRFDVIFAPFARMRLIHVENCADAIVKALEVPLTGSLTVNLVDSEQPSHWRYHRLARAAGVTDGVALPVPYWAVRVLGGAARLASVVFFAGKARLPETLDLARQRVRWRNLRYPNDAAVGALGPTQRVSLEQGIRSLPLIRSNQIARNLSDTAE